MHELIHAKHEHGETTDAIERATRAESVEHLIGTPQALAASAQQANIAAFLATASNVVTEDVIEFAKAHPVELGNLLIEAILDCKPSTLEPLPELKAAISALTGQQKAARTADTATPE